MKTKDVLPSLGRPFIAATLFVQAYYSLADKKMGSFIGLAASFLIYLAMNHKQILACSSAENCDLPKKKRKAA